MFSSENLYLSMIFSVKDFKHYVEQRCYKALKLKKTKTETQCMEFELFLFKRKESQNYFQHVSESHKYLEI